MNCPNCGEHLSRRGKGGFLSVVCTSCGYVRQAVDKIELVRVLRLDRALIRASKKVRGAVVIVEGTRRQ